MDFIIKGDYFDGVSARAHPINILILADQLYLFHETSVAETHQLEKAFKGYALRDCELLAPLGKSLRIIELPDGGRIESQDFQTIEDVEAYYRINQINHWIHRRERQWLWVLGGAFACLVLVLLMIFKGLPFLAQKVAYGIPMSVNRLITQEALKALDNQVFKASYLPSAKQAELKVLFYSLSQDQETGFNYELLLRSGATVGANALALPDGRVIMTDELVALSQDNDELVGVMLHEIAHVNQRHGLRSLVQRMGLVVMLSSLLGDVSSIMGAAATMPIVLLQNGYSRNFEREADRAAVDYFLARGLSPVAYRRMLEHLANLKENPNLPNILSTHPNIYERIERIKALE
ncbi:MAG: M48 family metallopeptidase [Deinococcales bacterium]